METERIALSQRERDRLKVLHEVQQKHLTQVAAAERLKISDRHVRRMLLRLRERGDRCVVHGLRGRPSNRKLAPNMLLVGVDSHPSFQQMAFFVAKPESAVGSSLYKTGQAVGII